MVGIKKMAWPFYPSVIKIHVYKVILLIIWMRLNRTRVEHTVRWNRMPWVNAKWTTIIIWGGPIWHPIWVKMGAGSVSNRKSNQILFSYLTIRAFFLQILRNAISICVFAVELSTTATHTQQCPFSNSSWLQCLLQNMNWQNMTFLILNSNLILYIHYKLHAR